MVFIICADLHLKESEKEYSFSVLKEVIALCKEKKCEALLLAGDIFDDWGELKHRADFRAALEELPPDCDVYYLPGNHEELRVSASGKLELFDFGGRARLLHEKPYSLWEDFSPEAELLAIPFQKNYSEYRDWGVPPKKKSKRILLAHGTVTGVAYTGPNKAKEGLFDDALFSFLQIDLAAMGHLHTRIAAKKENTAVIYPGSARVCNKGEDGKRCVFLGNTKTNQAVPLFLDTAGEYRAVPVFVNPAGEIKSSLHEIETHKNDWLHLEIEGVVEDEKTVVENLNKYINELKKQYRQVTESREKLYVISGISTHPLAIRFLDEWEKNALRYAKEEQGVYEEGRIQGLLAIMKIMEKQK